MRKCEASTSFFYSPRLFWLFGAPWNYIWILRCLFSISDKKEKNNGVLLGIALDNIKHLKNTVFQSIMSFHSFAFSLFLFCCMVFGCIFVLAYVVVDLINLYLINEYLHWFNFSIRNNAVINNQPHAYMVVFFSVLQG